MQVGHVGKVRLKSEEECNNNVFAMPFLLVYPFVCVPFLWNAKFVNNSSGNSYYYY